MAECDEEDAWMMFKLECEVEVETTVANAAKSRLMQSAVLAAVQALDLAIVCGRFTSQLRYLQHDLADPPTLQPASQLGTFPQAD